MKNLKLNSLVTTVVIALAITGCTKSDTTMPTSEQTVSSDNTTHFFTGIVAEIENATSIHGFEIYGKGAKIPEVEKQINDIRKAMGITVENGLTGVKLVNNQPKNFSVNSSTTVINTSASSAQYDLYEIGYGMLLTNNNASGGAVCSYVTASIPSYTNPYFYDYGSFILTPGGYNLRMNTKSYCSYEVWANLYGSALPQNFHLLVLIFSGGYKWVSIF